MFYYCESKEWAVNKPSLSNRLAAGLGALLSIASHQSVTREVEAVNELTSTLLDRINELGTDAKRVATEISAIKEEITQLKTQTPDKEGSQSALLLSVKEGVDLRSVVSAFEIKVEALEGRAMSISDLSAILNPHVEILALGHRDITAEGYLTILQLLKGKLNV